MSKASKKNKSTYTYRVPIIQPGTCPICEKIHYIVMVLDPEQGEIPVLEPLLQYSYPDCEEYISPRCVACYDDAIKETQKEK